MSVGDGGMESLDLLRRVAAEAYGDGDTEPRSRSSVSRSTRRFARQRSRARSRASGNNRSARGSRSCGCAGTQRTVSPTG